jgi:hypothetical protein
VLSAGDRRSQGSVGTRHSAAAELSYHDGRSVLSGGGTGSPDGGAEEGASPVGASPPLHMRAGSSSGGGAAPQGPVVPSLQYPSRLAQQSADAAVDAAASAGPAPPGLPSAASEDLSTLLSSRLSQALGLSPRPAHATPLAGGSSSETLSGAASAPPAAGHGDAFNLVTSPRDVGALAAPGRDPHAAGAAAGAPAFPPFQFSGGGGAGPMAGAPLRGKGGAGAAAALGSGHEEQDDPSNAAEHHHHQHHGMGAHLSSHTAAGKGGAGAVTTLSGDADTVTADGRTALSGASTLGAGGMWPGHSAAIGSGGPLMGTASGAAFSGSR